MFLPEIPEAAVWAIFLLPVASLLTIAFVTKPYPRLSGYVTIAAIACAFALSLWALDSVIENDGHALPFEPHEWLTISGIGPGLAVDVGLRIDGLSAIMLVVVTSVSLLVQFYSQGYMAGDGGYSRYYMWMSLFTAAMLGLVIVDSILMVYVFWELVGLGSYLLIGFWFHKKSAGDAAKKAFLTTRLGDVGFAIGILLIFTELNTFNIPYIQEAAHNGMLSDGVITAFALLIFAGAVGKSAQFPLHVWLPDAMEGPTPVSALIHAATMVAAGVYLVARMFPVFEASEEAMKTVAYVGGFTAIFAASIGIVVTDLKRVLAYSTLSQLGYMIMVLGLGGYVAAIFHLFTHAFFKALLFLGSGSVNHATGTFDMRKMGGLRAAMPVTYITFLIGSLSLAGVFPLAGFWSKDEILGLAWSEDKILFFTAMAVVFMTAFYTFRAVFLTFEGDYKGGEEPEHGGSHDAGHGDGHGSKPHESPFVMSAPLMILAVPAVLFGFWNLPFDGWDRIGHLLEGALPEVTAEHLHHGEFNLAIAAASTALALAGIALAYAIYMARAISAESLQKMWGPVHTLVSRKYYMDELYEQIFVRNVLYRGVCYGLQWVDTNIIDYAVNGAATATRWSGERLRWVQSGSVQAYGTVGFAGLLVATFIMLIWVER